MKTIESWFDNPDEKVISILGHDYLAAALQGSLRKSVLVLTNERLYQRGAIFYRAPSGRVQRSRGSKAVEVKNITMTFFEEVHNVKAIMVAILFIVLGIVGHVSSLILPNEVIVALSDVSILFGLLFMLISLIARPRLLIVDYPDGSISTYANWYKAAELSEFQEAVLLAVESAQNKHT